MILIYNQKLRPRSRTLRRHQTSAEKILWSHIRGKKVGGYQFVRQLIIQHFIVDFICLKLKLIIEVDGDIHRRSEDLDAFRQEQLELLGYTVLRFSNEEVEQDIESVISKIAQNCPHPLPS